MRKWARTPQKFGWNFTLVWVRWLGTIAGALGDEMARQLIEINVQEQADDWPDNELGECPICGGAARKAPDEPRVLTTTRGDVAWKQRVGNCPHCRRAFFPSESSVGN